MGGGHRIFFFLIYCSSSDLIHTARWLVFNFSLHSDFYLPLKYVILAVTKDVYITKCIFFWKTPFLEDRLFYPIAMYFPIQIQGFFQCVLTMLPNTQSSKTVTVNRSFIFPLSFPLRTLPRQGKTRQWAQLMTPLHSYQNVIIGHAILKSPPAFYAKKLRPKETIRVCTAPSEIRKLGLKCTAF